MAIRAMHAEWLDATHIQVRVGAYRDDASFAECVLLTVDTSTGAFSDLSAWSCTADPTGERCRVLGVLATHTQGDLQPAMDAYQAGGQEGLFSYLESLL